MYSIGACGGPSRQRESEDVVVLAEFDLSIEIAGPIFCLMLALEMIADDGVAFDVDDSAPGGGAVKVFWRCRRNFHRSPRTRDAR